MGKHAEVKTILSSAARTSTSYSSMFDLGSFDEMICIVNVTAASGTTPTLDITLQYSPDNVNWFDDPVEHFSQFYGVNNQVAKITNFGKYVRWKYTVGGDDPSFTFTIEVILKD